MSFDHSLKGRKLVANFAKAPHYESSRVDELVSLTQDLNKLQEMDVDKYVDLYVKN